MQEKLIAAISLLLTAVVLGILAWFFFAPTSPLNRDEEPGLDPRNPDPALYIPVREPLGNEVALKWCPVCNPQRGDVNEVTFQVDQPIEILVLAGLGLPSESDPTTFLTYLILFFDDTLLSGTIHISDEPKRFSNVKRASFELWKWIPRPEETLGEQSNGH